MIRFDQWMERCLYEPVDGFYASGRGSAGRRGDFITSPEVGPLFGAVLARQLDGWWEDLGRPDPFSVIDAGTGPGTLVRSLEAAQPSCAAAWRLRGFDAGDADEFDQLDLDGSVVIANELFDNLPFRIVERQPTGWAEVHVDGGAEVLMAVDEDETLAGAPFTQLEPGQRAPRHDAASAWVESVLERRPARLLVFDYGAPSTVSLAARGGWLRTYRGHQRGHDPYGDPGQWDITTDVGFDQLPPPSRLITQAEFLVEAGIDQLVEEGRRYWERHAAAPDLAAMRMRSRVSEADALLDPDGLGSWQVAIWA